MPTVDESVEVRAPLQEVYEAWKDFESFPQFMEHIREVRRTGPDETYWIADIAGREIKWSAKTTIEDDNHRIAWQATGDAGQSGVVTFQDLGPSLTRVHVRLDYKLPSRLQEAAAAATGVDDLVVGDDLENFKRLIERGEVR